MRKIRAFIPVAVCLFFCLGFFNPAMAFPIKTGEQNDIPYMNGGVGTDERIELEKKESRHYNLKLIFAQASGLYLSDVDVAVHAVNGITLFQLTSEGPWLYLGLPAGDYTISATYQQTTRRQDIRVGNYLRTVFFHWMR